MQENEVHPLDSIAEEFAQRLRQGEHPSVSEYAEKYPELAEGLRDLLPSIAMMERLKQKKQLARPAPSPRISQLGDFHILREVGRGGMGIVYEAKQESLNRQVALKILSGAVLDPVRLERFSREARSAARLHHTNIVPIFGVGEHEGTHYIVMQFIAGHGMNEVIRTLAMDSGSKNVLSGAEHASTGTALTKHHYQWVARVGAQIADALQYAHEQGVLHRDIKPANLLIDEKGTVWVTDFGLAKAAENVAVTRSGDIVGTLQYMAPEALRGNADARSDVYSLGLTLYEALTLRPPFGESSPAEMIRQITTRDPAAPRTIDPNIPRDLETILLKAISRDATHRYASAAQLSEDLRNFLQDRPITARRASVPERSWRWCRRNPLIATFGSIALVSMLIATIVGWIAYNQTSHALDRESLKRQSAEIARRKSDANVQLSLKAFEDIFNQIASGRSEHRGPGLNRPSPLNEAALLQSILSFYDRFANQNATNPTLESEAAKAHTRVGDIYAHLGETAKAKQSFEKAVQMYDSLMRAYPSNIEYQCGIVETYTAMYHEPTRGAEQAIAMERLRKAVTIGDQILAQRPNEPEIQFTTARAHSALAKQLNLVNQLPEAEKELERSLDLMADLQDLLTPGPPVSVERLLNVWDLADNLQRQHRIKDARELVADAIKKADVTGHRPIIDGVLADIYELQASLANQQGDRATENRARARSEQLRYSFSNDDMQGPPRPQFQGPPGDFFQPFPQ